MLRKEEYLKTVRRPYPPLFCSLVCMGYSNGKYFKGILKKSFRVKNMAHVDDVWYYGKAELKEGGQFALESWRDKKIFKHTEKEFKRREDDLIKAAEKSFEVFCQAYQEYMPALILVFAIDNFIETAIRNTLSKKLSAKKVDDLMDQLNVPLQDNFYKQEEYDLVTSSNLSDHVKKYKWLYARYGEDRKYTKEEAQEKLKNINKEKFLRNWKKQKKKLRNTISYAKQLLDKNAYLVDIFQYVIYYRTHRTDIMNKSGFLAMPILKAKAKLLGITYEQLLACSGGEVLNNNIPSKSILISRIKDACILLEDKRVRCLTGKDSKKLIQFFEEGVKQEKYLIIRKRKHLPSPVYWNIIYQTSLKTKMLYNTVLSKGWFYFDSGSHKLIFLKNDWNNKGEYIASRLLKDNKYFKKIENRVNLEKDKTKRFLMEIESVNFSKLTFKELINLGNKIKDRCLNYDSANVLAWFLGADKFQEKIYNLIDIPEEDFLILITPKEKTAVTQLEYKLLKYAKLVKAKEKNLEKLSQELANDYGWIPFDYDGPKYWRKDYFLKEVKKNVKSIKKTDKKIKQIERREKENLLKRREIIKKFKLNKKYLDLIKKAHIITLWTDERKKYTFQLYYWYSHILWELEKRYNIPFKNLKYLFTEELINIEKDKDYLKKVSNKRIKKDFIVKGEKGEITIISGKDKNKILKELEEQSEETEIKGQVACNGLKKKYIGRVKIILSPKQGNKLKKSEFLVATMTTPDYILLMKKAAGFITDEGGVTCHAAIVSREMNKPCIIGTKIATKVLKDGDLVEVDAEKGIVKILKRKNA